MENLNINYSLYDFETIVDLIDSDCPILEAFENDILYSTEHTLTNYFGKYTINSEVVNRKDEGPYLSIQISDTDKSEIICKENYEYLFLGEIECGPFNLIINVETPNKVEVPAVKVKSDDRIWEHDQMRCKNCGGNSFSFDWKFKNENQVIAALNCHSGYGLMLESAEITCNSCGTSGHFNDGKFIKIKTLIKKGRSKKVRHSN